MKEKFVDHRFSNDSLSIIYKCDAILDEYYAQGYRLSLRQLYYQLVARDFVENTVKSYKRVGNLVSDARLCGMLDWDRIEDRGREAVISSHWENPGEILLTASRAFHMDYWTYQPSYVEVFVEKDALSGVLEPVCRKFDVHFTANKGYSSSTAMYDAAKRLVEQADSGKDIHVIYLGDHDPSGIDMTRDVRDRLNQFSHDKLDISIHRIALNFDQVSLWNPPENPAKETDSRFDGYEKLYGDKSWELDAVEPKNLVRLLTEEIEPLIDEEEWESVKEEEARYKEELEQLASKYD